MPKKYLIDFDSVPQIGTRVLGYRGVWLTLIVAVPWERRDGTATHLLEWQADDGRKAVSGLRSAGPTWGTIAEARARRAEAVA